MTAFVRVATRDDSLEVRRILDAAMLEPGNVEARIHNGEVLVAGDRRARSTGSARANAVHGDGRTRSDDSREAERLLGALVLEPHGNQPGAHVSAVGVRRRHRGRGIGSALVERALEDEGRLTARFDDRVRPFYERLGFSIESIDGERHRGIAVADKRS
ncbi:GNAT family N-acetyltransferase [Natrarchaeobius halalkaliphilus]|uniref:GNAT family N-acetyltransferase n=1 Tax=Natrarchaeobius halalkaliphilus TaxID=1679091 RepID=A0A3N6LT81_9EURY|nr:GNAT family N-acetyltransferase [Natrarchaeobius halalkaliphilus]RQG93238.1 GNAT family N-acetyltransferase [Natrarchaeobius halalkaliphilus]